MSMQRAGQASFFASQHFDAHKLTLKSCSCVLDLMQIRFDANRVSGRSLPSERFHRSEVCAHGLSLHFYTAFAIAISCEKETSLSNIYYYTAYSVPVSIAIRSYLRRLRSRKLHVAEITGYATLTQVNESLLCFLPSPYCFLSFFLSERLFKFATRNQRFSSFLSRSSIILQTPVLCFEDGRVT